VAELGVGERVEVREERAEDTGRSSVRGSRDLVVARSFGPPAVVAECAAPLLRVGGRLVVSEPPEGELARWPQAGLRPLGLDPAGPIRASGARFQILHQQTACPDRFPRRIGIPAKRPLF
jgi:16S rRNA (guanine527-N7)-methyltransferase